jgi:glucosamine-6-phosphate deaminase
VIRADTAQAFAREAADWTCDHLRERPQSVLALPTGNTPLGLYSELIARSRTAEVSLASARIFNLDEYCGLAQSDEHSYAAFLQRRLIGPLGLGADRVRLLKGDAADMDAECSAYDAALSDCGGVDLCILGVGVNGHVAFNEPGSPWDLRTHIVHLSQATRAAHERQSKTPWSIPAWGVTMGIKSLMESRHILLLIAGADKETAKAAVYAGAADIDWPVTSVLAHPSLTLIELCAPAEHR